MKLLNAFDTLCDTDGPQEMTLSSSSSYEEDPTLDVEGEIVFLEPKMVSSCEVISLGSCANPKTPIVGAYVDRGNSSACIV